MEPKVRFKGFEGEWQNHKLAEKEFDIIAGGDINRSLLHNTGKYPVIANALTDGGILGFYEKSYKVEGPAVTITGRGDVGIAIARHYSFTPVVRLLSLKSSHNVDFLANAINCCKVAQESTGVPQLTTAKLQEYSIAIPKNFKEEDSIGCFFTSLDSLIIASNSYIASLKKLKTASLISMFPQQGETTPKVRFKGFEGEWKIKSFKELYKRSSIKNDLTYDSSKIISVANMYFKEDNMNTDETYLLTYNVMKLGDIAFEGNKSKSFAHGRFVENSIGNGIVSHVFVVFSPLNEDYDIDFWKYYINNEQVMGSKLVRCTKSSTMMTDLVVDDFLKETILVPSLEEQQELGRYFATLDRKIALETARLEKLKQIKLACLDKMFV